MQKNRKQINERDLALIRRFVEGDQNAFTQLVHRWEASLFKIAFRILGKIEDAEEARQTIFLRIVQSPQLVPTDRPFAAWIRRCIINEAISITRQNKKHEIINSAIIQRNHQAPAEQIIDQEEFSLLQSALTDLNPHHRGLLTLRFDECLTIREIGEVLGLPHSTVQSQLEQSLRQLRHALQFINSSREKRDEK